MSLGCCHASGRNPRLLGKILGLVVLIRRDSAPVAKAPLAPVIGHAHYSEIDVDRAQRSCRRFVSDSYHFRIGTIRGQHPEMADRRECDRSEARHVKAQIRSARLARERSDYQAMTFRSVRCRKKPQAAPPEIMKVSDAPQETRRN